SARAHQPAAIRDFETLALALIPKVDAETAAYVAECLAPVNATPPRVLASLEARIGRSSAPAPALDGLPLQDAVDRAGSDADLARELLAGGDLPALEAARLYLHADRAQRDDIRSALAGAGMAGRRPRRLRRPPRDDVAELLDAAGKADAAAFGAHLARCLDLASVPTWRFEARERHDLLALAVSAIGLCEEDAIRIFLTLVPEIARSVEAVFGLVEIFRRTPRSVSAMILEAALDLQITARASAPLAPQHGQDLADRPGSTARQAIASGKMPGVREWERQLRPRATDRTG
ncbi:MAG TPA: hypothetical protein VLQ65_04680, partial [Saliniramus sp.]|nr:hypothetical protein [Saliniramus sp.]